MKVSIGQNGKTEIDFDSMESRDVREARNNLRALVKTPGWKFLLAVLDGQVQGRNLALIQPLRTQEDVLAQEHAKGQLVARIELMEMPEALIDNITQHLEQIAKHNEDYDQEDE